MFSKSTRLVTVVTAAAGIPYVWFNDDFSGAVKGTVNSCKDGYSSLMNSVGVGNSTALPGSSDGSSPMIAIHQLPEVLRFDIRPRWIADRWPRVSTVRAEQALEGLRVPLVTGIQVNDVTGSLTYYFDPQQRLCRVTLRGQTGDERALVAMAVQQFGLKFEPSLTAGMFVGRWNGQPVNVLRISHAPVMRADSPNARFIVELEINDPGAGYGLSRELAATLQYEQQVRRWGE